MAQAQIMIVEDEVLVAESIRYKLVKLGYGVAAMVAFGEEAAAVATELRPDLVLMDMKLAGEMDGAQAARQIHERLDIPVVFLTAHADAQTVQRARSSEPYGYVLKPFRTGELAAAIEVALYKHQTGKKLAESERKLRAILEAAPAAVVITNGEGQIEMVNAQVEDLFGYRRDELLGQAVELLLPEGVRTAHESHRAGYHAQPQVRAMGVDLDLAGRRQDGSEFPVEVGLSYIEAQDGILMMGLITDISARRQVEGALKIKDSALASSINGIAMGDLDGRLTYVNGSFLSMWGYDSEDEVVGRFASEFWQEADAAIGIMAQLAAEGRWLGELVACRKDGTCFDSQISASVVHDDLGRPICMMASLLDVSARKHAEDNIEQLARFPSENPAPVLRVGRDGRVIYANRAAEPLLRAWECQLDAPLPDDWRAFVRDVFASGAPQEAEVAFGGQALSLNFAPVLDAGYLNVYGVDISDRKRAEEELRKLSRAVEQSPSTVVITDTEGSIEYVNPKFTAITGYRLDEVAGQNPRLLQSGEQDSGFFRELWDTILAGEEWRGEFHNRKKNGDLYWEDASISPVRNADGKTIHFVKVGEDITERKLREQRLQWQFEVNATLTQLSRALLSQVSMDDVSYLILGHAKRLTDSEFGFVGYIDPDSGYLVCPTLTRDIWEVCEVADKTPVFERFSGLWGWVLKQGEPLLTNSPSDDPRSSGTPAGHIPIRSFLSAPALSGEGVVGQVAVANASRDYTEQDLRFIEQLADLYAIALQRDWAEKVLVQRTEELGRRNEELDAFAHTVAHDLKNPLHLIINYAELTQEGFKDTPQEELFAYLRSIARNGRKMSNIIEELLLLAGVRNAPVELRPLDTASLVASAQLRLTDLIEKYKAVIVVPPVWPVALGYGPWIEEVWANYLSNAIKYGGLPPRIKLGAQEQDDRVRFWVQDNGPGLSADDQARLFVPFTQLDQVRARGHGLGLSIVRRIVERLGGEVRVESSGVPGEGCVFSFTLPGAKG